MNAAIGNFFTRPIGKIPRPVGQVP
jgi:hypothetical protein